MRDILNIIYASNTNDTTLFEHEDEQIKKIITFGLSNEKYILKTTYFINSS